MLQQYFSGALTPQQVQIEDALLNLVGIVGRVQKEYRVPLEKRLDVCYVLDFIKQTKWTQQSDTVSLFKRRYLLVLNHWTRLLPKPRFLEYFNVV